MPPRPQSRSQLAATITAGLVTITQNGAQVAAFDASGPWLSTFTPTPPPPPLNIPPNADFTFVAVGQTATFTDASSDPDGTIASHAWDFGDGAISGITSPVHRYASPGAYTVRLTVIDNAGAPSTRTQQVSVAADAPPPPIGIETTFDAMYPAGFALSMSTTQRLITVPPKPTRGGYYTDVNHGTKVYRLTDRATDATPGTDHDRHEYSKHQVWNKDSSRFAVQDGSGFWFVHDAHPPFPKLVRGGANGSMPGFAGDCEPIWSPDDAAVLWRTGNSGSLVWNAYNVETDTTSQLFTLAGKLPAGFTGGSRAWFKGEGRPSNDGRSFALMIETNAFAHLGTVLYDRAADRVVGWLQTNRRPDHVMTSPLGNYFIVWYQDGVYAFPRTFQGTSLSLGRKLANIGQHGDVALGANGEEFYVQVDYNSTGAPMMCINIATGVAFPLPINLYPVSGEATAYHVSGVLSTKRKGWMLGEYEISYAGSGNVRPAPAIRNVYDRIVLFELKAGGRVLNVADHYSPGNFDGNHYFSEPQASSNLDGTRIAFASNWLGRNGPDGPGAESYMVALPSTAIPA
jgi:hypothetical protein